MSCGNVPWPCSAGLVPEIQTRLHWTLGFGLDSKGFGFRTRFVGLGRRTLDSIAAGFRLDFMQAAVLNCAG